MTTLAQLASEALWVSWRQEVRNGVATKVPYNPRTGELAACNDPATWATRSEAEWHAASRACNGVGIILGPIGGDAILVGVDLDTCRNPNTEEIEQWAVEVIDRAGGYCEVSPSGTGVKVFGCVAAADKRELDTLFNGQHGRLFRRGTGVHCPAIEVYRSNRFFTTTGDAISPSDELALVNVNVIRWIIFEAGPKFAGKASGNGKDESRSAKAFRAGVILKKQGKTYEEIKAALLTSDDPEIVAWTIEKGLPANERELRRLFDRAGEDIVELPVLAASSFAGRRHRPGRGTCST